MSFTAYLALLLAMNPQTPIGTQATLEINYKKIGEITLKRDGSTYLTRLSTGHRVSVTMKQGKPDEASAVNEKGESLTAYASMLSKNSTTIVVTVRGTGGNVTRIHIKQ